MYRLRSADKGKPLLISSLIIDEYSEVSSFFAVFVVHLLIRCSCSATWTHCTRRTSSPLARIATSRRSSSSTVSLSTANPLRTKLTKTVAVPNYKTKFTPDALAMTVAPDRWSILLSQRRRWINSTVHNLAELMFLPDMCGFCCFGMRFVVMIGAPSSPVCACRSLTNRADLVGTLILPATFVYLVSLCSTPLVPTC